MLLQIDVGENNIGNMVLGDRNLPDGLLVERIRIIVIIRSVLSTVIGIQEVDTAIGGVQGACRQCSGVSGILYTVLIMITKG